MGPAYRLMMNSGLSVCFGFGYKEAMGIPWDEVETLNEFLDQANKSKDQRDILQNCFKFKN